MTRFSPAALELLAGASCRRNHPNTMVPSLMELMAGLAVKALILDCLQSRSHLYLVEDFIASCDQSLL